MARDCPKWRESTKRVSLISCTTDAYKKWATTIRDKKVTAYLDTGAERSLVTLDCVRRLGLAGRTFLLGQPMWESQGVALVVRAGKATLYKAEAIEDVFANLTLAEEGDAPERGVRVAVPIIVESGETAAVAVRADNCLVGF
ncbi:hypothetical protein QE152_g4871 [Popillia japonica]|uniref:Peptidase A2 domain-containing protein n=1 Tax=Popillia japonica TaxID=7064 RepID=A0AAW1MVW5_POPJA